MAGFTGEQGGLLLWTIKGQVRAFASVAPLHAYRLSAEGQRLECDFHPTTTYASMGLERIRILSRIQEIWPMAATPFAPHHPIRLLAGKSDQLV